MACAVPLDKPPQPGKLAGTVLGRSREKEVLRVAVLSRWHVHADQYAREIRANADADVCAVWDEEPDRGAAWAAELGVHFEADLDALLASDAVDAVCVTTPTAMHREAMVKAATAGKHIFTEKVLAATVADCRAIAQAVEAHGVKFCISFPRRTMPALLYAKQALDDGLFGRVTALRVRIAHDGAVRDWLPAHFYDADACGGGAMMDLGAHGMYLSRWLLGAPKRVTAVFNTVTGRAVDDNAVAVVEFESGAIAVNETSFASFGGAYSLEIDGTGGACRMLAPQAGVEVRSARFEDRGWRAPDALPPALPKPIDQWIAGCVHGARIEFDMAAAIELTELMEAAYRAQESGAAVAFR